MNKIQNIFYFILILLTFTSDICFSQNLDEEAVFNINSTMGATLYNYFIGDEHARYLLFTKWPKKDEFETSNDFEKRLLKWKIQNKIIRRFRFTNLPNVFPYKYNADNQCFSSISLYDIQNMSHSIMNQFYHKETILERGINKCSIVFNYDKDNSFPGLRGKGGENIHVNYSANLSDFDIEKISISGVSVPEEIKNSEFISISIIGLKCPTNLARIIKEKRNKLRWEIEFSTDMHVASHSPFSPYIFDIQIYKLRFYLQDSNVSFIVLNNIPSTIISGQEYYSPVNEIKLSEQQVLMALRAMEIYTRNKDVRETEKYLANNVLIKLGIFRSRTGLVKNYELNKDQYIAAVKKSWNKLSNNDKYELKIFERKIEILPDGKTAKAMEKSQEIVTIDNKAFIADNMTTYFFNLVNGSLLISEILVDAKM